MGWVAAFSLSLAHPKRLTAPSKAVMITVQFSTGPRQPDDPYETRIGLP